MRILFFIPRLTQGGAERQVAETAKLLATQGHKIYICVYNLENQYYHFTDNNVKIINFNLKLQAKLRCQLLLYRTIKKIRPDFTISYQETANKYLGRVAASSCLRKITRFIASERNTKLRYVNSRRGQIKYQTAYRRFDGFFTNSSLTKETMVKRLNIAEHKIFLLRNLVDTENFQPRQIPRKLIAEYSEAIQPEHFIILAPARIIESKNQGILIDVSKQLRGAGFFNFQFILAGIEVGSYADLIKARIKADNLESHFVFLNTVSETKMSQLYNLVDLVLLPSLWEGLSNAILEALASGKIVISTNVSDINQIITDGTDGFLVEVDAVAEMAEKILLIRHMDQAGQLAMEEAARNLGEKFGPVVYYNEFIKMLNSVKTLR